MEGETGIGLYVHIPFCRAKCAYCDFNSYPDLDSLHVDYVAALGQEIAQSPPLSVRTIYIGGGTPTLLPTHLLSAIIEAIKHRFSTHLTTEISAEANPGTVSSEKLATLRALGVNRLSLGVQSFIEAELRLLGRIHSAFEAAQAFEVARQAGFDSVSIDLLYGLPKQSLASWRASLEQALALHPDHLSLYSLTVEEGTPLAAAVARGKLPAPDPDLAADMYELAQDMLFSSGFLHYEISNWARTTDLMCEHNLIYWRNEPYLGLGAGAHSWLGGRRWSNSPEPRAYVKQVRSGQHPIAAEEIIDSQTEMGETMMMGLRLIGEGVELARFQERFGLDLRTRFADEIQELTHLGLIEHDEQRVILSPQGRLLGNQVFLRFIGDG